MTYCPLFLCQLGIGTIGFFGQSQFVGDARFGEASALKKWSILILKQKGKNQSKINCHSPLFVVLSCKAYPILIHYINDSTVV